MLIGTLILGGDLDDEGEDLNLKAVLLDTAADAAAAAGVALAGGIILATRAWYWLDPAAALLIALVIAYHALALIRKVIAAITSNQADDIHQVKILGLPGAESGQGALGYSSNARSTSVAGPPPRRSPDPAVEAHGHRRVGVGVNCHGDRRTTEIRQGRMPRTSKHVKRVPAGREPHPEPPAGTGVNNRRDARPAPSRHDR